MKKLALSLLIGLTAFGPIGSAFGENKMFIENEGKKYFQGCDVNPLRTKDDDDLGVWVCMLPSKKVMVVKAYYPKGEVSSIDIITIDDLKYSAYKDNRVFGFIIKNIAHAVVLTYGNNKPSAVMLVDEGNDEPVKVSNLDVDSTEFYTVYKMKELGISVVDNSRK